MDDVKRMIFLRKEVSQLHRNLLNEMTKSFAQNYKNIQCETVEIPNAKMDKNLTEMSEILETQSPLDTFAKNISESNEIAKRISFTKKVFSTEKMD